MVAEELGVEVDGEVQGAFGAQAVEVAGALAITGAALVLWLTRRRRNPPKSAVADSPAKPAAAAQVGG